MTVNQPKKEKTNTLRLNCKKSWQTPTGHWTNLTGGTHTDKRPNKPGKGGRKADKLRKQLED